MAGFVDKPITEWEDRELDMVDDALDNYVRIVNIIRKIGLDESDPVGLLDMLKRIRDEQERRDREETAAQNAAYERSV